MKSNRNENGFNISHTFLNKTHNDGMRKIFDILPLRPKKGGVYPVHLLEYHSLSEIYKQITHTLIRRG